MIYYNRWVCLLSIIKTDNNWYDLKIMLNYQKLINEITNFEELKLVKNKLLSTTVFALSTQQKLKGSPNTQKHYWGKQINKLKQEIDHLLNKSKIKLSTKKLNRKLN